MAPFDMPAPPDSGSGSSSAGGYPKDVSGTKHDTGELRWDLLPYDAVEAIVAVLTFGVQKHGERSWERGVPEWQFFAAAMRHLTDWWEKSVLMDQESGLPSLAHAACNILFLLAYQLRRTETDDRPQQGDKT